MLMNLKDSKYHVKVILLAKKIRRFRGFHLSSRPGNVIFCLLTCLSLVKDRLQKAF